MRKADLCLSSEGAEVILATSSDEKHPPENIIDGNAETFWTTTGMFPQEFIICFHKHVKIEKIIIQSYLVRTLRVEKSTSKEPVGFEQWIEKDLVHTEGQLQNEEIMGWNSGPCACKAGGSTTELKSPALSRHIYGTAFF
ncbi:intraflagellar transport protein 25 homolog isoform X3 [Fukomys damarensis]|uniref:intraflagellar transport protein 25 homolog isoform X3 n=1 Tax=Fukomys damarensis TaxID=885580 RepID=UPI0008FF3452|nr:intraflagellar transport protein 25 homolog isoform X3 [Fukomys damarensis]